MNFEGAKVIIFGAYMPLISQIFTKNQIWIFSADIEDIFLWS